MVKGQLLGIPNWLRKKIDEIKFKMGTIWVSNGTSMKEIEEEGRYYCAQWLDGPEIYDNGTLEVKIIPNGVFSYRILIFHPFYETAPIFYCRMNNYTWGRMENYNR